MDFFTTWKPDPVGMALNTGYMRFTYANGIHGLAKINPDRSLSVLAIGSEQEGKGHCRAFFAAAKERFPAVHVWHADNPILEAALERWGFVPAEEWDQGVLVNGWSWKPRHDPHQSAP